MTCRNGSTCTKRAAGRIDGKARTYSPLPVRVGLEAVEAPATSQSGGKTADRRTKPGMWSASVRR